MRWWIVFGLMVSVGCSRSKAPDLVVGNYVGWQISMGSATELNGKTGMLEKLALKADGTFDYQLKSNVMVTILQDVHGTWIQSGATVTLTGTTKGYVNDGYKNEPDNGPYSQALTLNSGMLTGGAYPKGEHYLRKEGTGAPPVSPSKSK